MTLIVPEAATEEATFDLTYEGLVAAHAQSDDVGAYENPQDYRPGDSYAIDTLRIHGTDVLAGVRDAIGGLERPIRVTVTVDGNLLAAGDLSFSAGYAEVSCADGCCGGFNEWEFQVGDTDVLEALESLHGGTHEVRVHGQGYVQPLIDVTLAHYTSLVPGARPTDRVLLPLNVASRLKYRVTTASRDRIEAAERARYATN